MKTVYLDKISELPVHGDFNVVYVVDELKQMVGDNAYYALRPDGCYHIKYK